MNRDNLKARGAEEDAAARAWEALLIAARQGHAAAGRQQEGAPQIRAVAS